jgi:chromosome segregation ATPase
LIVVGKEPKGTALSQAVHALDEELARFASLAATAERVPLTSERNLEKAARAINEAAESQQRVGAHIATLIDAISQARGQHDATAQRVIELRDRVQARASELEGKLARFAALGREAQEISARVRQLGDNGGKPPTRDTIAQLGEVAALMGGVVEGAATLEREAQAAELEELARQCDSLRQQVQSALNKVTLLRDKLVAASPV